MEEVGGDAEAPPDGKGFRESGALPTTERLRRGSEWRLLLRCSLPNLQLEERGQRKGAVLQQRPTRLAPKAGSPALLAGAWKTEPGSLQWESEISTVSSAPGRQGVGLRGAGGAGTSSEEKTAGRADGVRPPRAAAARAPSPARSREETGTLEAALSPGTGGGGRPGGGYT